MKDHYFLKESLFSYKNNYFHLRKQRAYREYIIWLPEAASMMERPQIPGTLERPPSLANCLRIQQVSAPQ